MQSACPFVPKSTSPLVRGHFWAIPLGDGRFGAGCVVGRYLLEGKVGSRLFIGGVIDWTGAAPPSAADLSGRSTVGHGFTHVKCIVRTGGVILGLAAPNLGGLPEEAESHQLPTWGANVSLLLARKVANYADH
jgi:hypothetical protein